MGNGLIFAFVVALWAAYFVPLAVRRYDEASRSGSIEKFSSLSRVIPHKRHVEAEDEVVETPAQPAPAQTVAEQPRITAPKASRTAARIAARRRRRTLLTLLAAAVIVGVVAALSYLPLWSIGIPVALIVAWLVACRIQVRGERGITRKPHVQLPHLRKSRTSKARAHGAVDAEDDYDSEATVVVSGQFEDVEPHRVHVMEKTPLEADALDEKLEIAVPVVTTTGEATWHPLPVTLPTYVTKPRAGRTVRTIEFGEPGAWTSGHIEGEDVELPKRKDSGEGDQRTAVGH